MMREEPQAGAHPAQWFVESESSVSQETPELPCTLCLSEPVMLCFVKLMLGELA